MPVKLSFYWITFALNEIVITTKPVFTCKGNILQVLKHLQSIHMFHGSTNSWNSMTQIFVHVVQTRGKSVDSIPNKMNKALLSVTRLGRNFPFNLITTLSMTTTDWVMGGV